MNTPIVCDYGTGFSKVGFAGVDTPRSIFPTMLGKLRHDNRLVGTEEKDWFIGKEAQEKRNQLLLQTPLSRGVVVNWDNMEKLWHHSFYDQLRIAPEQHPLMLTASPSNPMKDKEKTSQIMFETFNIPALHIANQAILSLLSCGKTSGMTVESGEGMTHVVPISEGFAVYHSILKTDVAGQDLTLFLLELLSRRENVLVTAVDKDCVRQVKEKCCYVALNFEEEKAKAIQSPITQKYQLPDGQEISVGQERFICPEALFQAELIGKYSQGIHMLIYKSISSCCPTLWKSLLSHILISGGTGSYSGLRQRLQKELVELISPTFVVKVLTCPFSTQSSWIGGSILASLPTFSGIWITQKEYQENGPSIIKRRTY